MDTTDAGHLSLDDLPLPAWRVGEGGCGLANQAWLDQTGLTLDDCGGDGWLAAFHEGDHHEVLAALKVDNGSGRWRMLRSGRGFDAIHVHYKRSSGDTIFVVVAEAQPEAEPDLSDPARSDHLRRTLEELPSMIWSTRPDGYLDYANSKLLDYFGLTWEQALGWGWGSAMHPDDWPGQQANWRRMLERGEVGLYEMRVGSPERGYRWAITYGSPLFDSSGKVTRWYGTVMDTESRRQTEEALRLSESYLSQSQSITRTGSIGFDPAWNQTYWSRETFALLDIDDRTTPSLQAFLEKVHPEDRFHVGDILAAANEKPEQMYMEFRVQRNGAVGHFKWQAKLIERLDSPFYVSVMQDITSELDLAERLRRLETDLSNVTRTAMMGELAASIAHEVNQPLAAILATGGASIRWLDRPEPKITKARSNLLAIVEQARKASDVVQRVRALFKPDAQQMETIDLLELLNEVIPLLDHLTKRLKVKLEVDSDSIVPRIYGDKVQLQQVFLNLLANALQAVESVPVRRVRVSLRHDGDDVAVEMTDTGPGITLEPFERVFEAFVTTKATGLGLGLSISRTIIERHGGSITAHNRKGGGSVFLFTLPVPVDNVVI